MSKKKFRGRKIVKSIKSKDSVFFTRNLRFIKKLTIAMEELNDYRSTPERADDQTSDDSEDEHRMDEDSTEKVNSYNSSSSEAPVSDSRTDLKKDSYQNQTSKATSTSLSPQTPLELAERCRYIPMRLTEDERRLLNVLENALEVCEYTDTVDVTYSHTGKSKQSRIISSLVDLLSIACGLLVSRTSFSSFVLNTVLPLTDTQICYDYSPPFCSPSFAPLALHYSASIPLHIYF